VRDKQLEKTMLIVTTVNLDVALINDCLVDLPASGRIREENSEKAMCRLHAVLAKCHAQLDHAWKGMDDNEAWAT
jgi:hypothetical protein